MCFIGSASPTPRENAPRSHNFTAARFDCLEQKSYLLRSMQSMENMMTGKRMGVPAGFPTISPYLVLRDAVAALEFYKQAFDAEEIRIDRDAEGKINNVELRIGTSILMLGASGRAPAPGDGLPLIGLYAYFEDVDAVFAQAVAAGATVQNLPTDQPYGDRRADLVDPFGIVWWIASRLDGSAAPGK
jgi:PhnB protein